jgi:adenine-specific DNA-methyltransferase
VNKKTKLELTWIGKDDQPRLEPRILIEQSEHSMPATDGSADSMLIQGDNLLALKALEDRFADTIRCIYIDPPYNTGSAFEHYDDGLEHSIWLSLMRERLSILRNLLRYDGSIWINIDDNEAHYLKVICDEVFGRKNFVTSVIWQKKYAPKADTKFISESHDFILVYAKNIDRLKLNRLPKDERQTSRYVNKDNDPRGAWKAGDVLRNEVRPYAVFPVALPSGREVWPPPGTSWRYTKEKFAELIKENRIWFGVGGNAKPALKRFISDVSDDIPAQSVWKFDEVGHNDEAKKESKALFGDRLFSTPKPERLVARVLQLASNKGDLVLDSFAGSGTTGAVAHKMGRRWIMVELGEHALTHCVPRLRRVVSGTEPGGITESVDWQGGGGFRFYRLAPSMLERDRWGNWVVSRGYNAAMLAEALCRHMGFTYAPSQDSKEYWKHGHSTERDFIYVTTQALTHTMLAALSHEVGPDRRLLICCKAHSGKADAFDNLTIRKIPQAVLANCEWGRDDYSLTITAAPVAPASEPPDGDVGSDQQTRRPTRRARKSDASEPGLFDDTRNTAED